MLFVTTSFLFFFLIVYFLFWAIPPKYRMNLLLISSIIFYASWSLPFTFHFVSIIIINYYLLENYKKTKNNSIFITLQIINLGNLAFFKYFYFFCDVIGRSFSLDFLLESEIRNSLHEAGYEIYLPLGISFYTFQLIAYGFDIKRGVYSRDHKLKDVLLFIMFFPQLIAGPILRSSDLLPKIADYTNSNIIKPDSDNIKTGLWYVLFGVIKKLFIADRISAILYSSIPQLTNLNHAIDVWFLCIAFIVMLYSDFSAYSDIARGLGFLFGFDIPINFKAPFFMKSFTDLWKRWHLTFAYWIKDYIFIPLGGSKNGEGKLYRNLIITFTLGGLWHGASYTFLTWGFLMALFLSAEAFLNLRGFPDIPEDKIQRLGRTAIVWVLYLSSGIFFFAPDFSWGVFAIKKMFDFNPQNTSLLGLENIVIISIGFITVLLFQWLEIRPENFQRVKRIEKTALPILILIIYIAITQLGNEKKDFFYFQF